MQSGEPRVGPSSGKVGGTAELLPGFTEALGVTHTGTTESKGGWTASYKSNLEHGAALRLTSFVLFKIPKLGLSAMLIPFRMLCLERMQHSSLRITQTPESRDAGSCLDNLAD